MARTPAVFFKMLSARSRLKLLELLAKNGEFPVEELARQLDLAVPTVSRHLQLLRMQELVSFRQDGAVRYYSIEKAKIAEGISAFLSALSIQLPESR